MTAITIRPIETRDLAAANRICNLAFGTFIGVPNPETFFGDMDFFRSRVGAPNTADLPPVMPPVVMLGSRPI